MQRVARVLMGVLLLGGALAVPVSAAAGTRPPGFTIAFTGDFLATSGTWPTAHAYAGGDGYDFRPVLERLRSLVSSADIGICHLETPLTGPGVGLTPYPRYAVPHELAWAVNAAGYDGCSTASNHSIDHGMAGIRSTLDMLDRVGLRHTGTARSLRERWKTTMYRAGGATVAQLSFTASLNGLVAEHDWEANRIDAARIIADARRARSRGADVVVLSLHWGNEYQHAPSSFQTALAGHLMKSGTIDLIVGHHAHVVQPIRKVDGRWVAYGLGNSFSGMTEAAGFAPDVQDGMVLLAHFERGPNGWHVEKLRYAPTWVEPGTWYVRLVGHALDATSLPAWELADLRASWARTVANVDAGDLGVYPIRRITW